MTNPNMSPLVPSQTRPVPLYRQPVVVAALIVFAGLIIAGLMVRQTWGNDEPQAVTVSKESVTTRTSSGVYFTEGGFKVDCVRLGDNLTCNWPK